MQWADFSEFGASVHLTSALWKGSLLSFPLFLQETFYNENPYDLTSGNTEIVCNLFNGLIMVCEQITDGKCFLDFRVKFLERLRHFK